MADSFLLPGPGPSLDQNLDRPYLGSEVGCELTFSQERIWLAEKLGNPGAANHVVVPLTVRGVLNRSALATALRFLSERHGLLLARIEGDAGRPKIVSSSGGEIPLSWCVADPEDALERRRAFVSEKFNLATGPMMRALVSHVAPNNYQVTFVFHHLCCDGWSVKVFTREFCLCYEAALLEVTPALVPLKATFSDVVTRERERMTTPEAKHAGEFWRNYLAGARPTDLPRLKRAQDQRPLTQRVEQTLPIAVYQSIVDWSRTQGVTLFATLFTAFSILLSKVVDESDVLVGTPSANRDREHSQDLICCLVNVLPLRVRVDRAQAFSDLVHAFAVDLRKIQKFQFYPATPQLRQQSTGGNGLLNLLFQLQVTPGGAPNLSGAQLTVDPPIPIEAQFDLFIDILRTEESLVLEATFDPDALVASEAEYLLSEYTNLLEALVANSAIPLRQIGFFSEKPVSLETGDELTNHSTTLFLDDFDASAVRSADRIAVQDGNFQVSYAALTEWSARFASHLTNCGLMPGDYIAVQLYSRWELTVTLLGILKAGGIFVLIDPSAPEARRESIATTGKIRFAVADNQPISGCQVVIDWTRDRTAILAAPVRPRLRLHGDNGAYALFTSGSTGIPKGALTSHRALGSYARQAAHIFALTSEDRVYQFASCGFDVLLEELFPVWLQGGCTVLRGELERADFADFAAELERTQITFLELPTEYWRQWLGALSRQDKTLSDTLRMVAIGGETVRPEAYEMWLRIARAELVNVYGLTETAITSCVARLDPAERERYRHEGFPIAGTWFANTHFYIGAPWKKEFFSARPGELLIGGPALALGFIGLPRTTAERFVPDALSGQHGARLYRTGDLVVHRNNGALVFIGRSDLQIKIRGFRVELEDIEETLRSAPGIHDALVISRTTTGNETELIAYYITAEPVIERSLREWLAQRLPVYMIPARYIEVKRWPLTNTGKIDRTALPRPAEKKEFGGSVGPKRIESIVKETWKEILERDEIGASENFFEAGGNSLRLGLLKERLESEFGVTLSLAELFQSTTILQHVQLIEVRIGSRLGSVEDSVVSPTETSASSIAVVGMAGRFPGARNLQEFWENLRDGTISISYFSKKRLFEEGLPEKLINDPHYVPARGTIEGAADFDAEFFGYREPEAELTDPQQRLLLECVWEALQDAGYARGKEPIKVGVYAGASVNSYYLNELSRRPDLLEAAGSLQVMIGNEKDFLTSRISHRLGLTGPSVNVQSACSTSLLAIHLACQSLRAGECDVAVAGGVSVGAPRAGGYLYTPDGILSADGTCRPFDAGADGTVGAEGVGAVVLRRVEDARGRGDRIRGIILGSASNNDGADRAGFTAPSPGSQATAIQTALSRASVPPDSIAYIETHGSGTKLGDAVEIAALDAAYERFTARNQFCALGALKANVGHMDAAAGIGGFIKTILAMENRVLPPFSTAAPHGEFIKMTNSHFYISRESKNWPRGSVPRRAGVSSFGLGGTNVHVVLEEAPEAVIAPPATGNFLLPISARSKHALQKIARELAGYIERASLKDIAYSLAVGREDLPFRASWFVSDAVKASSAIRKFASETEAGQERATCSRPSPSIAIRLTGRPGDGISLSSWMQFPAFRRRWTAIEKTSDDVVRSALGSTAINGTTLTELDATCRTALRTFVHDLAVVRTLQDCGIVMSGIDADGLGFLAALCLSDAVSVSEMLEAFATSLKDNSGQLHIPLRSGLYSISQAGRVIESKDKWRVDCEDLATGSFRVRAGSFEDCCELDLAGLKLHGPEEVIEVGIAHENASAWERVSLLLGQCWMRGVKVNWAEVYREQEGRIVTLPKHPLHPKRFWPNREGSNSLPVESRQSLYQSYHLQWSEAAWPEPKRSTAPMIIMAADDSALGRVIEKWIPNNHRILLLTLAEEFEQSSNQHFRVRPQRPDDIEAALHSSGANGWSSVQLVYGWALGCNRSASALDHFLEFSKAIASVRNAARVQVLLDFIWPVSGAAVRGPERAAVIGLAATLNREGRGFSCQTVDIGELAVSNDEAAWRRVMMDEPQVPASAEVCWRGQRRFLVAPICRKESIIPTSPSGLFIITGGLGEVGAALAETLLENHPKTRVVVISRLQADEQNSAKTARLQKLTHHGDRFIFCRGDVRNADQLELAITQARIRPDENTTILHAAGIHGGGVIETLSAERIREVIESKFDAALSLARMGERLGVQSLVLFSSIAALRPFPGESAYASACAALDALAQAYRGSRMRVVSINWDAWAVNGMVTAPLHASTELNVSTESGIGPEAGLTAILTAIRGAEAQVLVSASALQWKSVGPEGGPVRRETKVDTPEAMVTAIWAESFGVAAASSDEEFFARGGNSLIAVMILDKIRRRCGVTVQMGELFGHSTLGDLIAFVASRLSTDAPSEDLIVRERIDGMNSVSNVGAIELERPIVFLLSAPRSGSTLLRGILAGHPNLFAPPELGLLMFENMKSRQAGLPSADFDKKSLIPALESLVGTERASEIWNQWLDGDVETQSVYAFLQSIAAPRVLVDKTPDYAFSIETLRKSTKWFPNARYIHIMRHPGAVIDSWIRNRFDQNRYGSTDIFTVAEQVWATCCANIIDLFSDLPPERKKVVQYEELVACPSKVAAEICDYLGIPFDPGMLDLYSGDRLLHGIGDPNITGHSRIETGFADRWRQRGLPRLPSRHVRLLAAECGYFFELVGLEKETMQGLSAEEFTELKSILQEMLEEHLSVGEDGVDETETSWSSIARVIEGTFEVVVSQQEFSQELNVEKLAAFLTRSKDRVEKVRENLALLREVRGNLERSK